MREILESRVRQLLRGVFGAGAEVFLLDDDWPALLFVPDFPADNGVELAPAGVVAG